jgi:hypothetical protein
MLKELPFCHLLSPVPTAGFEPFNFRYRAKNSTIVLPLLAKIRKTLKYLQQRLIFKVILK